MGLDQLDSRANGWGLRGWVALACVPRGPGILSLIPYGGVALLCLAYTILIGGLVLGGGDVDGPKAAMDFTSLAGVMALFATKGGMVVGWVHYLAFDLFAGMWIARDADQKS